MKKFLAAITIFLAVAAGVQADTYERPLYYVKTSDWDSVRIYIKVLNNGAEVAACDSLITDNDTIAPALDIDSAYNWVEHWYENETLIGSPSGHWGRMRPYVRQSLIDSLQAALDSVQNHAAWTVATVTNQVTADVTALSGDATAANNLEAILDGNGSTSDVDITMRSLTIWNEDAAPNSGSAIVVVSANGDGLNISGGLHDIIADITGDIIGTVTPTDTTESGYPVDTLGSGGGDAPDSSIIYSIVALVATDSSTLYQGPGSSLDTSQIKTMIHNNYLNYKCPSPATRYIYGSGDNTDGLTWATAWTGFDSIKTLVSPTEVWVGPGLYPDVVCTLYTGGIHMEAIYGPAATRLRGTNDTLSTRRMISINPGSSSILTDTWIKGFSFAHRVGYGAGDPQFKCAIWICDSTESVEISNCLFPADSNYKAISSENDWVRYLDIHDNLFAGTHVHAIDIAGKYGLVHDNYFFDMRDSASIGVRNPIQIYTLGTHNAVFDNYMIDGLQGIAINGGDSNLVANNFIGLAGMVSQSNGVDNEYAGNWGGSLGAYRRRDAGSDAISAFVEEEAYDYWSALQTAMGGYNIFYSPCQVSNNWPDSTDPVGWGASTGTVHISSASDRHMEGYARALYIEEGSINTPTISLDTGTYVMTAHVRLTSATTDTAYFQCYKAAGTPQSWTDGNTVEYILGHTGWRRISHTIRLTTDTLYYFVIGANTGDSAYFANVGVRPFAATGNRIALAKADIADTLTAEHGSGTWTTGGDGGGSNSVTMYAVDTSGTDEARADTKLSVKNGAGEHVSAQWTNSSGYIEFKLDDGAYIVSGRQTGYVFTDDTVTVSGAVTDTVLGYDISIGTPAAADLSRVYAYLHDMSDNPIVGATITAGRVKGTNAVDSSGTGVIISSAGAAVTDTLGYFYIDLYRTGTYADTTRGFYNIIGQYGGEMVFEVKQLYVPDSGNVNLVDTLANRRN